MIPSRVHVSISLPSRRSWRASQAIFPRILVISSLMYIREPLSFRPFRMMALLVLCVVKEAMTSRGVALSSPFRPTLWERTISWAAILTSSFVSASSRATASVSSPAFSGIPRILMTFRREYCSSSSHFSSSSLTLVFSAYISEFFLAISKSNLPVIVLASPRSSCARCSVVRGPVTSSDVIAASSASISIVDWLDG